MKNLIKYILQKLLGLNNYMYVFARYKIKTLHLDKKENDFFHFMNLLSDGKGAILDIGSNLGVMSTHLARKFPQSTIHSFEPLPINYSVFQKLQRKFNLKNSVLHTCALGDEKGEVKMILPVHKNTVLQGLSHVKHESITEWNDGKEINVPIQRLDDFEWNETIQGIKIDIENFEYFALKGGIELIQKFKPIIYAELWENENRSNCFDLLKNLGYSIDVFFENDFHEFDPKKHTTQNFFFRFNN